MAWKEAEQVSANKLGSTGTVSLPYTATRDCFMIARAAANSNVTGSLYLKSAFYGDHYGDVMAINGGNATISFPVVKGDTISLQSESNLIYKSYRVIHMND